MNVPLQGNGPQLVSGSLSLYLSLGGAIRRQFFLTFNKLLRNSTIKAQDLKDERNLKRKNF